MESKTKTAIFAGGCFWCVEADFKKVNQGLVDIESGYSGGDGDHPTYENYSTLGHKEVTLVTYDPEKVTYRELVEFLIRHIDPTDASGSFADRGMGYSPAVFYADDEEKRIAEEVIRDIDSKGIYNAPLKVEVLPRKEFWPAEEYHQDYAEKNPEHYSRYRQASGREDFVRQHSDQELEKS